MAENLKPQSVWVPGDADKQKDGIWFGDCGLWRQVRSEDPSVEFLRDQQQAPDRHRQDCNMVVVR